MNSGYEFQRCFIVFNPVGFYYMLIFYIFFSLNLVGLCAFRRLEFRHRECPPKINNLDSLPFRQSWHPSYLPQPPKQLGLAAHDPHTTNHHQPPDRLPCASVYCNNSIAGRVCSGGNGTANNALILETIQCGIFIPRAACKNCEIVNRVVYIICKNSVICRRLKNRVTNRKF